MPTCVHLGNGFWRGSSTDTKPTTAAINSILFETDTHVFKFYNGTYWVQHYPSRQAGKRAGEWTGSNTGTGILGGFASVGAASTLDQTAGRCIRHDTTTTVNTYAGCRTTLTCTMRAWNPIFRCKFRLNSNNSDASYRFWLGLTINNTAWTSTQNADDPFNAADFVGIGVRSTDNNTGSFQIVHNDNAGATVFDALSPAVPVDTNVHTVEMVLLDTGPKLRISLDGAAYQDVTVDLPRQTAGLTPQAGIFNIIASTARNFDVFWAELESDK